MMEEIGDGEQVVRAVQAMSRERAYIKAEQAFGVDAFSEHGQSALMDENECKGPIPLRM